MTGVQTCALPIWRYYYHFNNHEKARYNLTKAVELNYNNADAKLLLSKVEEETGQYSSAICHINELLETYPYRKEYWIRKANLYGKLGNLEQSELLFKRINRVFPGDTTIMKHYLYSLAQTCNIATANFLLNFCQSTWVLTSPRWHFAHVSLRWRVRNDSHFGESILSILNRFGIRVFVCL